MKKFIHIWENRERDGKTLIYLKTKQGIETFEYPWYFCLKISELKAHKDYKELKKELVYLKKSGRIQKFEKQGEWLKIFTDYERKDNRLVKWLHTENVPTYEGDLKLWMRYLVDEDIELDIDQRILYFDIETDDTQPGVTPGAERITSIAAIGSDGKEYIYFSVTDEKKILKKFVKLVDKYDLLAGWNSEGFDLVAISKRCKMYNIEFGCWATEWSSRDMGGLDNVRKMGKYRARPETFNHVDLMMKVKEMHYRDTELIKKVRSFSLNAVSEVILGEKKIDRGHQSTYWLARNKPKFFQKYNMQDVRLLVLLDKKLNIIPQKLIEHQVCNARINDYTSHGKIDPYALRAARKMGQHFPTRPDKPDEEEFKEIDPDVAEDGDRGHKVKGDYIGGLVFEPEKGLHKDVYIFDYQSLYPSIIKTFNVSLDVYKGQLTPGKRSLFCITMPSGAKFLKNRVGIIPAIIQNILDERNKIRFEVMKKLDKNSPEYNNWHYRQYSFKVLANSMYGIMGASFSRYYHRDLAEGITLTGQYLIKFSWDWMIKRGHHPIYGDSDSLFVKLGFEDTVDEMVKDLKKELDEDLLKFNINESHMQMDFEKKFDRFILVAKKKYIGRSKDGDEKITGLELKKRDTLPMAEQLQRQVLELLLTKDKPKSEIVDIVKELRYQVLKGKMKKKDLTYQKRLSREIDNYGKQMKDKNGDPKLKKDGTERMVPIPIWVKVAAEIRLKVESGEKKIEKQVNLYSAGNYISYIIVSSGKEGLKAVWDEDYQGEYDREYYWNAIFSPTQRILEVVYPKTDWNAL